MEKQLLISVGREFGSGGHRVAEEIAKALDINYYSKNILSQIFADKPEVAKEMENYEEKSGNPILKRYVRGYTTSVEENLAETEFEFIREKADAGESFVLVGRCGEYILKDYPGHISIFIVGDEDFKVARLQELFGMDKKAALKEMSHIDSIRRKFTNQHSTLKWADAKSYDLIIDVSKLGLEGTTEFLVDYIKRRAEKL